MSRSSKKLRLRRSTFVRDDFTCQICGVQVSPPEGWNGEPLPPLTLGHIVPKSVGGTYSVKNIRPECRECNEAQGNGITFPEFRVPISELIDRSP